MDGDEHVIDAVLARRESKKGGRQELEFVVKWSDGTEIREP